LGRNQPKVQPKTSLKVPQRVGTKRQQKGGQPNVQGFTLPTTPPRVQHTLKEKSLCFGPAPRDWCLLCRGRARRLGKVFCLSRARKGAESKTGGGGENGPGVLTPSKGTWGVGGLRGLEGSSLKSPNKQHGNVRQTTKRPTRGSKLTQKNPGSPTGFVKRVVVQNPPC